MMMIVMVVLALFILTGCGLGPAIKEAGTQKEQYKTCVLHQIDKYSASDSVNEKTVGKATAFVTSACKQQEDTYVVAMTDLAMTITGNMVSRDKFLEDKDASLRGELQELAANLVEQEL